MDQVKKLMPHPEWIEHVVAGSNKDGIARFEFNETRQLIRAATRSAFNTAVVKTTHPTIPNTAIANVAECLREYRTLEQFACISTIANKQTIPILTCPGCGTERRTCALACGHKLCTSCTISSGSCPCCLKKHNRSEYAEIQSYTDPRSSQPGRSSVSGSSEFWRSDSTVWHIRPRETTKPPFDDPVIDRMENIFAADIPAASTSAHRLRYWKIEETANCVTAQVYFLQGNISFDPVREEDVKVAAIMSSTPSPPHRSVSEAVSWVCKQGTGRLFHRSSG